MTTRRRKGTDFQRWIRIYLEERGWIVYNQTLCAKKKFIDGRLQYVSTRQDIFSADLIARQNRQPLRISLLWIQATYSSNVKKRYEEFIKYFHFLLDGERFELWIKTKSGKINIFNFTMDGYKKTGEIVRRKYSAIKEI